MWANFNINEHDIFFMENYIEKYSIENTILLLSKTYEWLKYLLRDFSNLCVKWWQKLIYVIFNQIYNINDNFKYRVSFTLEQMSKHSKINTRTLFRGEKAAFLSEKSPYFRRGIFKIIPVEKNALLSQSIKRST